MGLAIGRAGEVGSCGKVPIDRMGFATGEFDRRGFGGVGDVAPDDGAPDDTSGLTLGEAPMEAGQGNDFGIMPPTSRLLRGINLKRESEARELTTSENLVQIFNGRDAAADGAFGTGTVCELDPRRLAMRTNEQSRNVDIAVKRHREHGVTFVALNAQSGDVAWFY